MKDLNIRPNLKSNIQCRVCLASLLILFPLSGAGCSGCRASFGGAAALGGSVKAGVSYYGMMHPAWPCAKSLRIMHAQTRPSVSLIWNVFGRRTACLKKFIADPRRKIVEIHLVNACCQRNHNCQSYDLLNNISAAQEHSLIQSNSTQFRTDLLTYIQPIIKLVTSSQSSNTKFIISPELESNLPCSDGGRLIDWLKPAFPPTTKFAWSAIQGCRPSNADYQEYHGFIASAAQVKAPCLANLDGDNLTLPVPGRRGATMYENIPYDHATDYLRNTSACLFSHLWAYELNGGEYNYTNPDRRARTNWPSSAVLTALQPFLK